MTKLPLLIALVIAMTACGGSGSTSTRTPSPLTANSIPAQPAPQGPNQFSWSGFTWKKIVGDQYAGDISGVNAATSDPANISVDSKGELVITLSQSSDALNGIDSVGGELATLTPLGFGTYTYIFREDVIVPGSVADGFLFTNKSQTEIDGAEQQGQYPNRADFTNWNSATTRQTSFVNLTDDFTNWHTVSFVWTSTSVTWLIDGNQVAYHEQDVPTVAAPFIFQLRGTNSTDWGGLATVGVTRTMYVQNVTFQPAQ